MAALPVAFRTNAGRYNFLGTTTLINAFAEQQGADGKGPLAVLPCHGTLTFSSVTDTPCRGMLYMPDTDILVTVHENSVYTVTSDGTATRRGVIPGIAAVQIARNQRATPQVVILDDNGSVWVLESNIITKVTDSDLPSPIKSITEIGGFIVYYLSDSRFFLSSLNEAKDIAALDFATAEASPDRGVRAMRLGSEVYFFGDLTTEPWRLTNVASDDIPLQPMPAVIPKGLMAPNAVCLFDNSLAWLSHDGLIGRLNGYQFARISNNEVERAVQSDADQSSIAFTSWAIDGHEFLNVTGSTYSYTYDALTTVWHKRESYGDTRWRHQHAARAWGKVIVGDRDGGSLYTMDRNTYTEAGSTIVWKVRSPTMHAFPNGGICDALYLDVATGVGLVSDTAQGYEPKLMLGWSNDGGNTFPYSRQLDLGKSGRFRTRVKATRTGKFGPQGRVWEIAVSDPVPRALVNVDAKVRPLAK